MERKEKQKKLYIYIIIFIVPQIMSIHLKIDTSYLNIALRNEIFKKKLQLTYFHFFFNVPQIISRCVIVDVFCFKTYLLQ